jgi:hypothetical protein
VGVPDLGGQPSRRWRCGWEPVDRVPCCPGTAGLIRVCRVGRGTDSTAGGPSVVGEHVVGSDCESWSKTVLLSVDRELVADRWRAGPARGVGGGPASGSRGQDGSAVGEKATRIQAMLRTDCLRQHASRRPPMWPPSTPASDPCRPERGQTEAPQGLVSTTWAAAERTLSRPALEPIVGAGVLAAFGDGPRP